MSTNESPQEASPGELEEEGARQHGGQNHTGGQTVPLFMKESKEGRQGDAQDEKDEAGE